MAEWPFLARHQAGDITGKSTRQGLVIPAAFVPAQHQQGANLRTPMSDRPSKKIRRAFLDYFVGKGHQEVPSSSLVPANDPTLMFANAGMNQFKDVFTGKTMRPIPRATSSQKCVRAGGKHNDLENVGRTARHHTFFEMLGNFSFGDYFKADAIAFAYELLTKNLAIDPKRMVYTVHHTDDEARRIWKMVAGVEDSRVVGLGDKDNFWAMGEIGPCGPCSEIHFHQGDDIPCAEVAAGHACQGPACDCDRWVEIWNLVFMQFEQLADRTRKPLPKPSVDTGMGLERLCAVIGGFRSNYETDLLRPLIGEVEKLTGKTFVPTDYAPSAVASSMRAIADHARSAAFLIADGVFPEKTGREYVLRRIMRRAIYHGWLLGIDKPFLAGLASRVIDELGDVYGELVERRKLILEVTDLEERRFRETLDRGMRILDEETAQLKTKTIPGAVAFKLYDTFGFPMDLTRVIGASHGLEVDEAGFENAMAEQRSRGEFSGSGDVAVEAVFQTILDRVGATKFVGYEQTSAQSEIVALVADGKEVQTVAAGQAGTVAMICRQTPLYGEQGGQVGDTGSAKGPHGSFSVADTKRPVSSLYVHLGTVSNGVVNVGDRIELAVDTGRRDEIRRNHSATHLLHWALRKVLGGHVAQKGSLVTPDRLRFDFSHVAPMTADERRQVEDLANDHILRNLPVVTEVLPIAEAKQKGAVAFFGEKYGETVRVLSMGESKEFCGGTHAARTGDIGLVKIVEESGVAQGVRRMEAVTGRGAMEYLRKLEAELASAAESFRSGTFEVAARVAKQAAELRECEKEVGKLKAQIASGGGRDPLAAREQVGKYYLLVHDAGVADPKIMRESADKLRPRMDPGVLVLAGAAEGKVSIVCAVTPGAQDKVQAGAIVGMLAKDLGGKGGGRADMAQGGGALPAGQTIANVVEGWTAKLRDHLAKAG
jgi:alanyl-tRNA synthetase